MKNSRLRSSSTSALMAAASVVPEYCGSPSAVRRALMIPTAVLPPNASARMSCASMKLAMRIGSAREKFLFVTTYSSVTPSNAVGGRPTVGPATTRTRGSGVPPTVRLRYLGSTDEWPDSDIAYQASFHRVCASTLLVTKNSKPGDTSAASAAAPAASLRSRRTPAPPAYLGLDSSVFAAPGGIALTNVSAASNLVLAIANTSAG